MVRWDKIKVEKEINCLRCGGKILAGEEAFKKSGVIQIDRYEKGKDELEENFFHAYHFLLR